MALGTIQCPCYTAYSADSKRCALSQRKFLQCSTKAVASSIAFASCEGETFALNSGSFLQCANCWQELCTIIRLTQYFNTVHLRLMPRNLPWIPLMAHADGMSTLPKTVQNGVTELKGRGLGTRQANNKNRITTFLFIKPKPECQKGKNRKPQWIPKPKNWWFWVHKPKNRSQKWLKLQNRKTRCPPHSVCLAGKSWLKMHNFFPGS